MRRAPMGARQQRAPPRDARAVHPLCLRRWRSPRQHRIQRDAAAPPRLEIDQRRRTVPATTQFASLARSVLAMPRRCRASAIVRARNHRSPRADAGSWPRLRKARSRTWHPAQHRAWRRCRQFGAHRTRSLRASPSGQPSTTPARAQVWRTTGRGVTHHAMRPSCPPLSASTLLGVVRASPSSSHQRATHGGSHCRVPRNPHRTPPACALPATRSAP